MEVKKAFRVEKRVIRSVSVANKCKSFRESFKVYRMLTVTSLYILVVSSYINMEQT